MPIELDTNYNDDARIKVIGVGGGGGNAINNMINSGLTGVDFIVVNTDNQALEHNRANTKITLGVGLGAGGKPEVAKSLVESQIDEVREVIKGSDMVFITAGMGGGTGTGASPVIAKMARELNALVVGIVTTPFSWEGRRRISSAEEGIKELKENVDALIVIQNQRLLEIIEKTTSFQEAYQMVDRVLYDATRGISDIISCHGVVNVDFADVVTVMKGMGDALMGIGTASGDDRAVVATKNALKSPILDGVSIKGSQGVLVNITGGKNLTMQEISEAVSIIEQETGNEVNLIHGVVQKDEDLEEISVTVVATGFKKAVQNSTIINPSKKPEGQQITIPLTISNVNTQPKREGYQSTRSLINAFNIKTFSQDRYPSKKPKGLEELDKYNLPAYQRRGVTLQESKISDLSLDKNF